MPNHTTNLLTIVGHKRIRPLLMPYMTSGDETISDSYGLNECAEESTYLDFNKIVPMPKEIERTCEMAGSDALKIRMSNKKEDVAKAKAMEQELKTLEKICQKKYKAKGWYEWSNRYWGTKWNSYENRWDGTDDDGNEQLYFQTAWSPPEPVLRQLAIKLKKVVRVSYMDEGYGFFGVYHFYPDGSVDDECYTEHKDVPETLCDELGIESYEEAKEMEQEAEKFLKTGNKKKAKA